MAHSLERDWCERVPESKLTRFLQSYFGKDIRYVYKVFDEAYGGNLFQVYVKPGFEYIPHEEDGSFRLGAFGLVTDNKKVIIPQPEDDFSLITKNPVFYEDYINFVASFNKGIKLMGRSYSELLNERLGFYINFEKAKKLKEVQDEFKNSLERKERIINMINNVEEKEK